MADLILNSAHNKYPVGADPWVSGTVEAVGCLAEKGEPMLCSTDPVPWNLALFLAGRKTLDIGLIVKACEDDRGYHEYGLILDEYALDRKRTYPLFIGEISPGRPKKIWPLRDRYAIAAADAIYPVSIRPGGKLDTLLSGNGLNPKVRSDFRIAWETPGKMPAYDFTDKPVNPLPGRDWLVHWTRSSQGPWPGEKAWEFYRDLLDRPETYVRSARETLSRILREGVIRSTAWRLPDGVSAVSFTSLDPENAVPLMRWRKRFVRYSFEPYGIGIRKDVLAGLGAKPVRYTDGSSVYEGRERLFAQSAGARGDWRKEREWRFHGDVSIGDIPADDLIVIVPDGDTARDFELSAGGKYRMHALFGE